MLIKFNCNINTFKSSEGFFAQDRLTFSPLTKESDINFNTGKSGIRHHGRIAAFVLGLLGKIISLQSNGKTYYLNKNSLNKWCLLNKTSVLKYTFGQKTSKNWQFEAITQRATSTETRINAYIEIFQKVIGQQTKALNPIQALAPLPTIDATPQQIGGASFPKPSFAQIVLAAESPLFDLFDNAENTEETSDVSEDDFQSVKSFNSDWHLDQMFEEQERTIESFSSPIVDDFYPGAVFENPLSNNDYTLPFALNHNAVTMRYTDKNAPVVKKPQPLTPRAKKKKSSRKKHVTQYRREQSVEKTNQTGTRVLLKQGTPSQVAYVRTALIAVSTLGFMANVAAYPNT